MFPSFRFKKMIPVTSAIYWSKRLGGLPNIPFLKITYQTVITDHTIQAEVGSLLKREGDFRNKKTTNKISRKADNADRRFNFKTVNYELFR